MSDPVHLLYPSVEGLKFLTEFFNSHLAQDTFHVILTACLLVLRPTIKKYSLILGSTWRARLDGGISRLVHQASAGNDARNIHDPSGFMKLDVPFTAFEAGKEVKEDLTNFVPPGVLSNLNTLVAETFNHPVNPHISIGPLSPGFVISNLCVALGAVVILSGFLLILLRWCITFSTPLRVKAHSQSDRGGGTGRSDTTFNSNSGSNPGQDNRFRSDNDSTSNPEDPSGSGSGPRRGPNPPPPNPSPSDALGVPPTVLSILNGTYINPYFGSGAPPPPPPPPSGNSVLDDPSDSESEYESDIWRHPHRLRFGPRIRVKARNKHHKNNKHRRPSDPLDNLNGDLHLNPNHNIEIEIPPGLIYNGDVLPSELEMEKQEKMRDLMRFVSWCAGISGVSGLVRVVWPPTTNATMSDEVDVYLHDVLDGEAHSVVGIAHSPPSMTNLETIPEVGNLASQTAAASWAFVNRSLDFPSGISAYDFDLAVDLELSFEPDVDLRSDRSANAITAMLELLQGLLWEKSDNSDSASDMMPGQDWVDLTLAKTPLSLSLGSDVKDESCARDSNSGVILCLSSTSPASSDSVTVVASSSSSLPSSFSISAEDEGRDHFESGASLGVCPNVPSFYKGCETYAALFVLEPPTKTVTTSVGVGVQNPFMRRLGMLGILTQPVYEHSIASQSTSSAVHSTVTVSPSLHMSRVSANPWPKMIGPIASASNPKSHPKPGNSGSSPSTMPVGQSGVSKPRIPFMAFNVTCAIFNVAYGLSHSSWGFLPLLITLCIFIYTRVGRQITATAEGTVTTASYGGEHLNMMDESDNVLNTPTTVYDPKHTPVRVTPSKIPVSITRVDVRDVLRRLDIMYETGDTTMFSSDSGSWSSSSVSSDMHLANTV